MDKQDSEFQHLQRPCPSGCPFTGSSDCQVCNETEQFIRYYLFGPVTSPMTDAEKEWCAEEADHCGEGSFDRDDVILLSDKDIADAVMTAWRQFVQGM